MIFEIYLLLVTRCSLIASRGGGIFAASEAHPPQRGVEITVVQQVVGVRRVGHWSSPALDVVRWRQARAGYADGRWYSGLSAENERG